MNKNIAENRLLIYRYSPKHLKCGAGGVTLVKNKQRK